MKARVLADIRIHLTRYGARNWDLVIQAYPQVTERTFYRWVKEVRDPADPADAFGAQAKDPVTVEARHMALEDGAARARAVAVSKHLPAVPPPEAMTRLGAKAEQNIDFLLEIRRLWSDILKVREHAIKRDEGAEDGWTIKNPILFDSSIKRRLDAMETALKVMQEIWDLTRMQEFFDEIVEIIVDELAIYPETQDRVIRRLAELNERRGMTVHAGQR